MAQLIYSNIVVNFKVLILYVDNVSCIYTALLKKIQIKVIKLVLGIIMNGGNKNVKVV